MEQQWNDTERGKLKDFMKDPSQYHFAHHKSHMLCPGSKRRPLL
jgi:hypothetical protein